MSRWIERLVARLEHGPRLVQWVFLFLAIGFALVVLGMLISYAVACDMPGSCT